MRVYGQSTKEESQASNCAMESSCRTEWLSFYDEKPSFHTLLSTAGSPYC